MNAPVTLWRARPSLQFLLLLLALILLFPARMSGQQAGETRVDNGLVRQAKEHQLNLEYDQAQTLLEKYLADHADDLRALNLLGTVILYREMFARGLLESQLYGQKGEIFKPKQTPISPEFQQSLFQVLDKAQAAAEERLRKDPKDKEAMYWAGVAHGTRVTFQFTLRRAYLAALHEAKDATRYHRDLMQLDPQYVDAQLILGVNDYVVGSLPWFIKLLAALAGAHGDRKGGLEKVQHVAEAGHYAREDARFMLDVLYGREKMYQEALGVVQELAQAYPRNFLLQMELAGLYRNLNEWSKAAEVYDRLLARHRAGAFPALPAARIMYLAGQAYETLQQNERALALYQEAGKLSRDDPYILRAQKAAAELAGHMHRPQEAHRE